MEHGELSTACKSESKAKSIFTLEESEPDFLAKLFGYNKQDLEFSPLTQLALHVTVLVVLHVFVLAEEVPVDVSASEQPHVRVVRDGAVRVVRSVQRCTLGLGFCRCNQERNAEQPQQLLRGKHFSCYIYEIFIKIYSLIIYLLFIVICDTVIM